MTAHRSVRFLSWNLNMMNTSAEAPSGWRVDQTESLIRQRVLEHDIDVVCFQELPAMVPYIETHELAPANTISHNGNRYGCKKRTVRRDGLPSGWTVCCRLRVPRNFLVDRKCSPSIHPQWGRGAVGSAANAIQSVPDQIVIDRGRYQHPSGRRSRDCRGGFDGQASSDSNMGQSPQPALGSIRFTSLLELLHSLLPQRRGRG